MNTHTRASWSTRSAEPGGIGDEPETPPVWPEENGYMLLDTLRTRQDQDRCVNCGKRGHITWQCVEIGDLLFAR